MSQTERSAKLFRIADRQQGLFTAAQARQAGYPDSRHGNNVRKGYWIREIRNVYRLRHYPETPEQQKVLYALWSANRRGEIQGVYSHSTALVIHEISDVNPVKLHMTVPPRFRRRAVPAVLVLHRARLLETEVLIYSGFLVTSVYRTLCDVLEENAISHDLIVQAISQAWEKGALRRRDIEAIRANSRLDQLFVSFILKEARVV